jgi:DNA polymerase-3 subunit gamma/tau
MALYRRFRPDTFSQVIGQEQVTVPLTAALRAGKVNHAYLFSGPRGCGKTTSARILARTLNCARNALTPSDTPCGECESCLELARSGPGSVDVVEIDAASHGGVDSARDLRERASFTPSRDKYKIFIIDEAHMVTKEGFNALLKVVEEPPAHIKFIFATTEPEKVLATIRSRTHHYPFRLVPPDVLGPYLQQLATLEGVTLDEGVLPIVLRAGGGSVRDSQSVLDQLIAGSHDGVVALPQAVALLGFTPLAILNDAIFALGARDGKKLFQTVAQVVNTGNPPARFVEELLTRVRDLVVTQVAGGNASALLADWPAAELEVARQQAALFTLAELTQLGQLLADGLSSMAGTTPPQLQLELLCAGLLVALKVNPAPIIVPTPAPAPTPLLEHVPAAAGAPVVASVPVTPVPASVVPEPGVLEPMAAKPEVIAKPEVVAEILVETKAAPVQVATRSEVQETPKVFAKPEVVVEAAVVPKVVPVESPIRPDIPETSKVEPPAAVDELAALRQAWPEIVLRISSPVAKATARDSNGPVEVTLQKVVIGYQHPGMVDRMLQPRVRNEVTQVLQEHLNRAVTVEATVGGAPTLSATAGPTAGTTARGSQVSSSVGSNPALNPPLQSKPAQSQTQVAQESELSDDEAWLAGADEFESEAGVIPVAKATSQPQPAVPDTSLGQPTAAISSSNLATSPASHNPHPVQNESRRPPAWETRQVVGAAPDEVNPDDEEITQNSKSGVALVVEMLEGRIIEEGN